MKKGFTLAEVLGVIIILSIIIIIAQPMINKNIQQSKENALNETISNIKRAARLYAINNSIGYDESYKVLEIEKIKQAGLLEKDDIINPVTEEVMTGCIVYRYIGSQYEFEYAEPCPETPTMAINNKDGIFSDKGWASSGFYVNIEGTGANYSYCVGNNKCNPDTKVENSSGSVYINNNGNNYVCAYAQNIIGQSETICKEFKLDNSEPVIASTTVYFDKGDNKLYDLLDITSISGHEVVCDKENISELVIGDNTVNCTITSNSGKSITRNISFKINKMRGAIDNDLVFIGSSILKEKVESIKILNHKEMPSNVEELIDVSEQQNRSVVVWYIDEDKDGMYEMYIGQNGGVVFPTNCYALFANFSNVVTMDAKYADTSLVTNMGQMFYLMGKLTALDISGFNTSIVTNMGEMFKGLSSLSNIDVSHFNTSKVESMAGMFNGMVNLTSLDISNFNTSKVEQMWYMFYNCKLLTELDLSNFDTSSLKGALIATFAGMESLTKLDLSHFDTSRVTSMYNLFNRMKSLVQLDISNFNTSNVTDMEAMFRECESLTSLDLSHFDTSNVTDIKYMFRDMTSLVQLDISNFNTSNVTDMDSMFYYDINLASLDVSGFDTSKVTNMSSMFGFLINITELDVSNFDTSKVTNMSHMFVALISITTLNLSNFDTSNVVNMSNMFREARNLTSLDLSKFDTSKVTNMDSMFDRTLALTSLDVSSFNTSNVTNMRYMFYRTEKLIELDISNFDTSKVENMSSMFQDTKSLEKLDISKFNFNSVTSYNDMFNGTKNGVTITLNENIKTFIESRLNDANKTATFVITS